MEPRRTRQVILASVVAALAIVALIFAAVASCTPEPGETPSPTPPAETTTTEPSTEPTTEPTEEATVEPEAEAEGPTAVILSASGIGDVAMGTADPVPTLLELLGPDGTIVGSANEPSTCGGPDNLTTYRWNDLLVRIADGALWGWTLRGLDLPADVTTQSGVMPGAPLSDAMALPGAGAPEYWDSMDSVLVGADDVWYWADGSDPATGVISSVQVNSVTCD